MKVSVIIPTYNREAYLAAAIDSVLNQTLPGVEVIVVDDGTSDGTERLAAAYAGRIDYLRTANIGYAHARNLGMQRARGDYIAFLDSDDLYYPYKLALQAQILDRHPDLAMVYSEFSSFDDRGPGERFHIRTYHSAYRNPELTYDSIFQDSVTLDEAGLLPPGGDCRDLGERRVYFGNIFESYLRNVLVFANSMMLRRRVIDEFGYLNETLRHFIELDFLLKVCRRNRVAFVDIPTYHLRYHTGQMSTTANADGTYVALQKQHCLLRTIRRHIRANPDYYAEHRRDLDLHLARLHRAVAVPLLACEQGTSRARDGFPRRARQHLARCWALGRREPILYAVSFLPPAARRVAFSVLDRIARRRQTARRSAPRLARGSVGTASLNAVVDKTPRVSAR
jgi:glycosyltransferase involved in cell wall biosynthesis